MHLMKHVLIKHIYWQQIEPVLDWTSHMSLGLAHELRNKGRHLPQIRKKW